MTAQLLNGTRRRAAIVLVVLVGLAQLAALAGALPVLDGDRGHEEATTDGPSAAGPQTDATTGLDLVLGQIAALLGMTLVGLVLKRQSLISNRALIRGGVVLVMTLATAVPVTIGSLVLASAVGIPSLWIDVGGVLAVGALAGTVYGRPRWWNLTAFGLLGAVGLMLVFGAGIGILPIVLLCVLLLVYDALAVYGSGHMVELADGALDLQIPVLVAIPTERGGGALDTETEGVDGVALGLGDVIIPGFLVVASARAVSTGLVPVGPYALPVATMTCFAGVIGGLASVYALDGGPHAGLPPMIGGGLVGYLGGAAVTGTGPLTALGLDSVDVSAVVSGQTAGLAAGIVIVGAALFWYGSRGNGVEVES